MRQLESFQQSYERLQRRFDGKIHIVSPDAQSSKLDASQFRNGEQRGGFVDISGRPRDLFAFCGRVILVPSADKKSFNPAVVTRKDGLQLTRLMQPYDPRVGLSDGIRFGLGLKTETASKTFGTHTRAGGLEAGHFAPVLIATRDSGSKLAIQQKGDSGTHSVGSDVGGVPEKMIQNNMLDGVRLQTVTLRSDDTRIVPAYWHPSLESNDGMAVAEFNGNATHLMLGAAANSIGDRLVDQVGSLVDQATRGVR